MIKQNIFRPNILRVFTRESM